MCRGQALKLGTEDTFPSSCAIWINLKETKTDVFFLFCPVLPTFTSCQSTVFTTQVSPSLSSPLSSVPCSLMFACMKTLLNVTSFLCPVFVALAFESVDALSPNSFLLLWPRLWALCAHSSCGTLMLRTQHDDPEVSASKTPKSSWHHHKKAKYYPNAGFYQGWRHESTGEWDCSGEEGALVRRDDAFWVDFQPGSIRWSKDVGRQTTEMVRRMREE